MKVTTVIMIDEFLRVSGSVKLSRNQENGGRSTRRDERGRPSSTPPPTIPTHLQYPSNTEFIVFAASGAAHGFTLSCSRCLLKNCYSTTHCKASAMDRAPQRT